MEGDAGTRRLNPTDADETPDESLAVSQEPSDLQTQEATAEDFRSGSQPTLAVRRGSDAAGLPPSVPRCWCWPGRARSAAIWR